MFYKAMKISWMKVFYKGQQFTKVLWDGCRISHIFISGRDPFCLLLKYSTRLVHSQHGRPLERERVVLCVKESFCVLKSRFVYSRRASGALPWKEEECSRGHSYSSLASVGQSSWVPDRSLCTHKVT